MIAPIHAASVGSRFVGCKPWLRDQGNARCTAARMWSLGADPPGLRRRAPCRPGIARGLNLLALIGAAGCSLRDGDSTFDEW